MSKSTKVAVKRRGRPATGKDPTLGGRVPQATIDAMDAWAEANGLSRSEALRVLIEAALKRPPKVKAKG